MKRFLTILLMTVAFAMNVSVVNAKNSTGQGGTGKEFLMAMIGGSDDPTPTGSDTPTAPIFGDLFSPSSSGRPYIFSQITNYSTITGAGNTIKYSSDGSNYSILSKYYITMYADAYDKAGDGVTLYAKTVDGSNENNESNVVSKTYNKTGKPTITWDNSSTITITGPSGCNKIVYTTDGGSNWTYVNGASATISYSGTQSINIQARAYESKKLFSDIQEYENIITEKSATPIIKYLEDNTATPNRKYILVEQPNTNATYTGAIYTTGNTHTTTSDIENNGTSTTRVGDYPRVVTDNPSDDTRYNVIAKEQDETSVSYSYSDPVSFTYNSANIPVISCENNTVTISNPGDFYKIYYTKNQADNNFHYADDSSTPYTGAFPIDENSIVCIYAVPNNNEDYVVEVKQNCEYTQQTAQPTISVSHNQVTISCSETATIYYTTDGSTPTTSSQQYIGAFPINGNTTVNAIAVASGKTASEVASLLCAYQAPPTITHNQADNTVYIYGGPQVAVYYSTDNGQSWNSRNQSVTLNIPENGSLTVQAYSETSQSGHTITSNIVGGTTYNYVAKPATPTISIKNGIDDEDCTPPEGQSSCHNVTDDCTIKALNNYIYISTETNGASIYYTTDNSDPTDNTNANRHELTDGKFIFDINQTGYDAMTSLTVKAAAFKDNVYSAVQSVEFNKSETPSISRSDNTVTITAAAGNTWLAYKPNASSQWIRLVGNNKTISNYTDGTQISAVAATLGCLLSNPAVYPEAPTLPAPEFTSSFQGKSEAGQVAPFVYFGISNYGTITATEGNQVLYSYDGVTWKTEIQTKSSAPEIGCILAYADDFERSGNTVTIYAKTVNGNNESAVVSKEYTKTDAPTVVHNNGIITITAPQTDWDEIMFSTDGGDNWFIHKSSDGNTFDVYPTTQDAPSYDGESPLYVLARAFKSGGDYIYSNQDCFIGPAPIKQLKYHYSEMENWFEVNSVVGLKIRYTLDGNDPKTSETAIEFRMDSVYMDKLLCSSLEVDSKTVKTVATDGYGHFSDVVEKTFTKSEMPIFTDYGASIELKVNDSYETIHNVIYYKQNSGDWDNTTWTPLIYKKDFNTIQAVAVLNNWQKLMSDMLIVEVIDTPPTLTYNQNANQVTITCEEGKDLMYSTDGGKNFTKADGQSQTLAVPQEGSLSVQAYCTETKVDHPVANKTTIYTSDVSTGNYTYTTPSKTQPDAPTITYTEGSGKVTISTNEEGTTGNPVYLIYTINGDEPVLGQHYTVENGVPTASDANTVVVTGNSTSFYITSTTTVNAKVYCGKYTTPASDNAEDEFTIVAPAVQPKVTLINDYFKKDDTSDIPDYNNYFMIKFDKDATFDTYSIVYEFTRDGNTLYYKDGASYSSYEGTITKDTPKPFVTTRIEGSTTYTSVYNATFNPLECYINNGSSYVQAYPFDDEHPLIIKMRVQQGDSIIPGVAYSIPYIQSTAVVPEAEYNGTDAQMEVTFDAEPSGGYSSTNPLTFYYRYSKKSSDVWSDRIVADEATDFTDKITYTTPSSMPGYVYTVSSQKDHLKVAYKYNITKYAKPDKPGISYDDTTPGTTTVTIHTDEEGTTEHPAYLYYTTDGSEPVINGAGSDNPSVGPGTKMVELNDKSFTLTIDNGGSKTVKAIVYCPNNDKYTTYESDDSIKYCPVWRDWQIYGRGAWEYTTKQGIMYVYNAEHTTDIWIATDIDNSTHKRIKIDGMMEGLHNDGLGFTKNQDQDDYYNKDFIFEWDMDGDGEICYGNYQYMGLKKDENFVWLSVTNGEHYDKNTDSYHGHTMLKIDYCSSNQEYKSLGLGGNDVYAFTLKMDGLWLGDMEEKTENSKEFAIQKSYMPRNSHYKIGLVKIPEDGEDTEYLTFEDGKCFINSDIKSFFEDPDNSESFVNAVWDWNDKSYKNVIERHWDASAMNSEAQPLLDNTDSVDIHKMLDQFKITEEGAYYIVAARLVPNGEANNETYSYSGAYRYMPVYYSPSSNWKTLSYDGMRTYRDDFIYSYYDCFGSEEWDDNNDWFIEHPIYSVEVQENPDKPGLFRVKNMYHEGLTGNDGENNLTSYQGESPYRENVYFYIDTRGDEKTDGDGNKYREAKLYPSEFYAQPLGFDWESGEMMLTRLDGGKYIDGQIVFESRCDYDENSVPIYLGATAYEFDDLVNNYRDTKPGNVLPADACWPVNCDYNDDTKYGELYDNRFKLQISTPYPLFDDTPYTTTGMNPKWPKEYKDEEKGIDNSDDYNEKYGELAIFDSNSLYYNNCYTDGITEGQDHVDVTYERDLKEYNNTWGTIMLPCPLKASDLKLEVNGEIYVDEEAEEGTNAFNLYRISGFSTDHQKVMFTNIGEEIVNPNTPVVFKSNQHIASLDVTDGTTIKLVIDNKDTKVDAIGASTDENTSYVTTTKDENGLYIYDDKSSWRTIANYTPVAFTTEANRESAEATGYNVETSYELPKSYVINRDEIKQATGGIRNKQYRAFFYLYSNPNPTQPVSAKSYSVFFDDDPSITDIDSVVDSRSVRTGSYNVAGQKVNRNYRGIVIENGKKSIRLKR